MIKTCTKCGEVKEQEDFYKTIKGTYQSKCKECVKKAAKKRYYDKYEEIKKYEKSRASLPHRVKARKEYAQSDKGKVATSRARGKWLQQNPDKRAAQVILGNAVRDGKIAKPKQCSKCNSVGRICGHHYDYCKPLEVIWLCTKCHNKLHLDVKI